MHAIITPLIIALLLVHSACGQPPQESTTSSKNGTQQRQVKKGVKRTDGDKQSAKPNKNDKSNKAQAAQNAAVKPPANAKAIAPAPVPMKRIRELFQFVDENHRALRPLLKTLERRDKNKFQVAMRSLDREVKNLQNQKKNSPSRYGRSLKIWVLRSQAKLVAAKIVTSKSDKAKAKLKKELASLVNQQYDLRQNQLAADLQLYQNRVERLKKQQAELRSKRSEMVDRQVESLVRSVKGMARSNKKNPKTDKSKKTPPKSEPKKTPKKSIGE